MEGFVYMDRFFTITVTWHDGSEEGYQIDKGTWETLMSTTGFRDGYECIHIISSLSGSESSFINMKFVAKYVLRMRKKNKDE